MNRVHFTAALSATLLCGCAATPPAPTAALNSAHLAISNAERADAGRYAAGELSEARARLASAEFAVARTEMVVAERMANESRTEAELASATTAAAKARDVNADMEHSNRTLNQEMQRNAGEQK